MCKQAAYNNQELHEIVNSCLLDLYSINAIETAIMHSSAAPEAHGLQT